jgi:hypothetical protein
MKNNDHNNNNNNNNNNNMKSIIKPCEKSMEVSLRFKNKLKRDEHILTTTWKITTSPRNLGTNNGNKSVHAQSSDCE